ncbi:hypothetical protein CTA2_10077 [Colletotrichum tanaceti]|uniref:Uncharacterized protein n=1 Tax=Colletotrichum tanaceti TaxID=1306861 RepID=A0A4U6X6J6_9PEZI|nr:hypothetical protein CTA2_10077 [Colletotrichum tanaceti]TKW51082.1 hypothetical protein CTA1_6143 [Colletotrichum tanaceti]
MATRPIPTDDDIFCSGMPPPPGFVTTAPPDIRPGTIVVAAAAPDVERGHPDQDGWLLSDFYAFNYLLKGVGGKQVWLTAADPLELTQAGPRTGRYLHGNPSRDRKLVLSKNLLDANELTPVTLVRSLDMTSRFLEEVHAASRQAVENQASLLLLVFSHSKGNWEFLLDGGNREEGLSVAQLRGAIAKDCHTVLYSPVCYSGGWFVRDLTRPERTPLDDITMPVTAGPKAMSDAWQNSPSVIRACGSIFANAVIDTLTSSTSPLLDGGDRDGELRVNKDDEQQSEAYRSFCHSVLDICSGHSCHLAHLTSLTFDAPNDQWDWSWTRRTGISLTYFKERWDSLATVQPNLKTPGIDKGKMLPEYLDPSNQSFSDSAAVPRIGEHVEVMRSELRHDPTDKQVKEMAERFLQTCPGDWDSGWGPLTRGCLRAFINGDTAPDPDIDVAAMMAFRWEVSLLADCMVRCFNLAAPNNEPCIMWDRAAWACKAPTFIPEYEERHGGAWGALRNAGVEADPSDVQGPPFVRFAEYLTAAIAASTNLSRGASLSVAVEMGEFMRRIRQSSVERNIEAAICSDTVITKSRELWKTLGRGVQHE